MGPLLVFMLTWYQLHATTQSALMAYNADANGLNENAIGTTNTKNHNNLNRINTANEMDDIDLDALLALPPDADLYDENPSAELPLVRTNYEETEVEFRHHPITSVNIDYAHNSVVLKFRKDAPSQQHRHQQRTRQVQQLQEEEEQRRALEKNFMRFGRSPTTDFMRFGKREMEQFPLAVSGEEDQFGARSGRGYNGGGKSTGMRDSRGDNFMRFGRASSDFMRFGRDPGRDYMRFGRAPSQDFMRFGRTRSDNFMRLGRGGSQSMRLLHNAGGADSNFMRFGRHFGPPERDQSENFMRLGKLDQNFMRFGKSSNSYAEVGSNLNKENRTKEAQQQKQELRATAKLLHQAQTDGDENPMDKAIQVLFSKQQQQSHKQPLTKDVFTTSSSSLSDSSEETADDGNSELDTSDYALN